MTVLSLRVTRATFPPDQKHYLLLLQLFSNLCLIVALTCIFFKGACSREHTNTLQTTSTTTAQKLGKEHWRDISLNTARKWQFLDLNLFKQLFSELQGILNTLICSLFIFLKLFLFMCTCMSLCAHVHICVIAHGGEKKALEPQELEHNDCILPNMCGANWT